MNTFLSRRISAFLLTLAVNGTALAIPLTQPNALLNFQDIDAFGVTLNAGESANGTFDIVNAGPGSTTIGSSYANAGSAFSDLGGYVLGSPITSVTAYFYIRNGNQGNDVVSINLGNSSFFNSSAGPAASSAILAGGPSISLLQSNGLLSYSVAQSGTTSGSNFIFDYAQLQVTSPAVTTSVPDNGTSAWLLVLGLAGCVFGRRRRCAV